MLTDQQRYHLATRLIRIAQANVNEAIQAIRRKDTWNTLESLALAKACLHEANHWWKFPECFQITDMLQQLVETGCEDWRQAWICCFDLPTDIHLPAPKAPGP